MEKNRIKSQDELKLEKIAEKNFEAIKKYQQNPIKAKLSAFLKTKKQIEPKDFF